MIELWEAAKRANLSEDELDSLKVVLTSRVTAFLDASVFTGVFLDNTVLSECCSLAVRAQLLETF